MDRPPPLDLELRRSRRAFAWIVAVAGFGLGIVVVLPCDAWVRAVAAVALVVWSRGAIRTRALRLDPCSVRRLRVGGERRVAVTRVDGRVRQGSILAASYVGALVTTIVWRPDGAWLARAELVLPDMLPRDDARRLRVLLRYGRSDVAHDAPASHA